MIQHNYRKQIEEKLGVELPPPNESLPEEVEVNLSRLVSEAGKQLTQSNQQKAAQAQAQQQMQDPLIQMQQKELQIKEAEVQRKAQKDQADIQLRQGELQRKAMKDMADVKVDEALRIELMKSMKPEGRTVESLRPHIETLVGLLTYQN